MLTFYYATNTCALASHIVLEEAGAAYETRWIDFGAAEQTKPEYLKINPKCRVPALNLSAAHSVGGQSAVEQAEMPAGVGIDSFAGPVRVEWDREAALTALGQLSFFIDFLKTARLFEAFVADCPLR